MKNARPEPIYLKNYQVPNYLIDTVDLEFELDEHATHVQSILLIRRNPDSKDLCHDLKLDGDELELHSIQLDGKTLSNSDFQINELGVTIFNVPTSFELIIKTIIKPQENTALSGLYKSSGNFCTQCEAHGFRRITYFLDRPDVMARYTTKIIADEHHYPLLLSNGNLIAKGNLDNGKHWVKWEDPFKKPCYLFALVAGDLEFIEDTFITRSGRTVSLRIYVEKGNKNKCDHAMQAVKKAMRWDEEKYGREYDLDIYMLVAVSDFNMGAMENKGLNIFNTKYILASPDSATDKDYIHVESVIAHEYFHNWTGNRITCRDWFQLSLKEGLTIFRDQSFTADTTSKTVARILDVNDLRTVQFTEDAGPLAHPVRPNSYIEINNFYTSTVYNKGAELVRMLQTILGEDLFRLGMDLYFERFDGQAVTIEEFISAHEEASNQDLTQFRIWYSQSGTPILNIQDHFDALKKTYTLNVEQICLPTTDQAEKQNLDIPLKIGLLDKAGNELVTDILRVKDKTHEFIFKDISTRPVPSLLRHFSAPVKVQYDYSEEDLITLFQYDTDLFNRWEAGQRYASKLLIKLINNNRQGTPLTVSSDFIDVFKNLLQNSHPDKGLLSEMLILPSEKYLAEQVSQIDVDGIHTAREFVISTLANELNNLWVENYQRYYQDPAHFIFNYDEVGKRQFKNLCLFYLMHLNDPTIYSEFAMKQFSAAITNNMTDTMAALQTLANVECHERTVALSEFYAKWRHDALTLNKWFAIQAMSKLPDTLDQVKKLVNHEDFDLKNPNKVYSLIGAFGNNQICFHDKSGAGYQFITDMVLQLDTLNPQVAARMIKPLTDWRRVDENRQKLMQDQLNYILRQKTLSKDLFELVTKSIHARH